MNKQQNLNKQNRDYKKIGKDFARYSSMVFEMLAIIGGLTWLAIWLDEKINAETPWFTIFLSPFSVLVAIWVVLKDLNRNK